MLDREAIKLRIDAARDATGRSRFALLATTVGAVSFLIAEFNAYISWNRGFALKHAFASDGTPTAAAQQRLVDDWVTSSSMNVSLFGIHVNASDMTFLGGIAMMFLTLWFYYAMRRENRLVGTLLRNTRDASLDLMDLVYSGIVSYMVFTAVQPDKPPIDTLGEHKPSPSIRKQFFGVQLLFALPPFALVVSIILDLLSLWWFEAPFREDHRIPPLEGYDLLKFAVFSAVGLLCCGITVFNALRIRRLDRATGNVLREYNKLLREKTEMAKRLGDSRSDVRTAHVSDSKNGIHGDVHMEGTMPPKIVLAAADPSRWRTVVENKAEIEKRYFGKINWDAPTSISVTGPEMAVEQQVEFLLREAFLLRRLLDAAPF